MSLPRPTESELLVGGIQETVILTSPLGDLDVHSSLRTTDPVFFPSDIHLMPLIFSHDLDIVQTPVQPCIYVLLTPLHISQEELFW